MKQVSQTLTGFFEEGRLACLEVHDWQKICLQVQGENMSNNDITLQTKGIVADLINASVQQLHDGPPRPEVQL